MAVKVRIVETGEEFKSILECARKLDGDVSTIAKCIRGERNTYRGLHFEKIGLDRGKSYLKNHTKPRTYITDVNRGRPRIAIQIVETGDVFDSICECARVINGDTSEIAKCLKGYKNRKSHLGLHFEKVVDV